MTYATISTPHALSNNDGSAHKAKLARLERRMNANSPGANIALIDRVNVIEVQASERVFVGRNGEKNLGRAFDEACAELGY